MKCYQRLLRISSTEQKTMSDNRSPEIRRPVSCNEAPEALLVRTCLQTQLSVQDHHSGNSTGSKTQKATEKVLGRKHNWIGHSFVFLTGEMEYTRERRQRSHNPRQCQPCSRLRTYTPSSGAPVQYCWRYFMLTQFSDPKPSYEFAQT